MQLIVSASLAALRKQAAVLLGADRIQGRLERFGCSVGPLEQSVLAAWERQLRSSDSTTSPELRAAPLGRQVDAERSWEAALPSARWVRRRSSAYPLDLALVSIGEDGSLGPLRPKERFFSPPETTASSSRSAFLTADRLLVIASGSAVAEAVAAAVEGDIDETCPASGLRLHPSCTLLIDATAASQLTGRQLERTRPEIHVFDPRTVRDRSWVVLSPHPDDTSVSCGGLIDQVADHNRVVSFLMCSGHHADIPGTRSPAQRRRIRLAEAEAEGKVLRADVVSLDLQFYDHRYQYLGDDAARLAEGLHHHEADVVLVPSIRDQHPAHRITRILALEALRRYVRDHRPAGGVELWGFEGPWGIFDRLDFNVVVPVPETAHRAKIRALRKHRSQIERLPYDRAAAYFSQYRSLVVPELRLASYGQRARALGPHVELFDRERLRFG